MSFNKPILFYSPNCKHSIKIWKKLKDQNLLEKIIKINISIENNIPPNITRIPSLLIRGRKPILGDAIELYFNTFIPIKSNKNINVNNQSNNNQSNNNQSNNNQSNNQTNNNKTNNNQINNNQTKNQINDFNYCEMGNSWSDNYSFLNNKNPIHHSYSFLNSNNKTIVNSTLSQTKTNKNDEIQLKLNELKKMRDNDISNKLKINRY